MGELRVYTKTFYGIETTAYKDSGYEWVISTSVLVVRYPTNTFTMRHAMELTARMSK